MELLHIYSDGSKLYKMSALALTCIPVWKGNRIIDMEHVSNIKNSIQNKGYLLDSGYKIIQYEETDEYNKTIKQSYIIDGQHRINIVKDYFDSHESIKDFEVTVTEIKVNSELDAILYFNTINNVKPIHYEEDINLIANKYIYKLHKEYNSPHNLFRNGITKRPYLSIDKLREALKKRIAKLKIIDIDNFVIDCKKINGILIQELEIRSLNENDKDIKIIHKSILLNFALSYDDKFKWLDRII